MVIFINLFVRVKMGGKIQTSLKLRSRRNASQKMSLRVKQIGFSENCSTNFIFLTVIGPECGTFGLSQNPKTVFLQL